jgi:hypothetical protein
LIPQEKLIKPGAAMRLDLDAQHEWALLDVIIATPGRYRITADGISGADPEMRILVDDTVRLNDDKGPGDRNSELVLDLNPGEYKLAIRTWRSSPGTVVVSVQGPL